MFMGSVCLSLPETRDRLREKRFDGHTGEGTNTISVARCTCFSFLLCLSSSNFILSRSLSSCTVIHLCTFIFPRSSHNLASFSRLLVFVLSFFHVWLDCPRIPWLSCLRLRFSLLLAFFFTFSTSFLSLTRTLVRPKTLVLQVFSKSFVLAGTNRFLWLFDPQLIQSALWAHTLRLASQYCTVFCHKCSLLPPVLCLFLLSQKGLPQFGVRHNLYTFDTTLFVLSAFQFYTLRDL